MNGGCDEPKVCRNLASMPLPAMQSRIFERFEQVDKSLERGNSGLGVGLTLARNLVELTEDSSN